MVSIVKPKDKNQEGSSRLWDWLEVIVLLILGVSGWLLLPLMAGLLLVGLEMVGKGLLIGLGKMPVPDGAVSAEAAALQSAVKGIEFFLLAPIGYFILLSVSHYVRNVRAGELSATDKERLLGAKGLVVGLLIAVVAADLTGKVLSREGLSMATAGAEVLVVVVLGLYFFGLEALELRLRAMPAAHDDQKR